MKWIVELEVFTDDSASAQQVHDAINNLLAAAFGERFGAKHIVDDARVLSARLADEVGKGFGEQARR